MPTRPHPLAEHDPLLRPVLRGHPDGDPFATALAVTVRGLDADPPLPVGVIRRWLLRADPDRFAAVASTPRRFNLVARKARSFVSSSQDAACSRERQAAAVSLLVGRLLTPLPPGRALDARRHVAARHVLALVGLEVLEALRVHGWDTALVSVEALAVRTGSSRGAVRRALGTCVELGWLRRRSTGRGGASRYALASRLTATQRETAWRYVDVIDALADGRGGAALADLIGSAGHAAWGYGAGARMWLTAVAVEAEVDPVALGVPARALPKTRREWLALWLDPGLPDRAVVAVLDAAAVASGADARAREAQARRQAAVEARVVELAEFRERRAKARRGVDRLLDRHPVPGPGASNEEVAEWAAVMATAVAGSTAMTDELRRDAVDLLAQRLGWRANGGRDTESARALAVRAIGG